MDRAASRQQTIAGGTSRYVNITEDRHQCLPYVSTICSRFYQACGLTVVAGSRMQSKARSVPMPVAGTPSVNNPGHKYTPHNLQLKPGAEVTGKPLLTSSNANSNSTTGSTGGTPDSCDSRSYQLESELHRGPRSAVWRALDSTTKQPVVLKVRVDSDGCHNQSRPHHSNSGPVPSGPCQAQSTCCML